MKVEFENKYLKYFTLTFIICMAFFGQAIHFPFFVLDDKFHITNNLHINLNIDNILWFWKNSKTPVAYNIWQTIGFLGGVDNPTLFRLTNIIIHAVNTVLVYRLILHMGKSSTQSNKIAVFCASLFALHPIQIESVVWISSLRGLVSTLFTLLAMNFSLSMKRGIRKLFVLVILYILALTSKPTMFLLPVVFIVFDLKVNNLRLKATLKDNIIHFFLLGVGVVFFSSDVLTKMVDGGVLDSIKLIFFNFQFYIGKTLFADTFGYETTGLKEVYNYSFSLKDYILGLVGIIVLLYGAFISKRRGGEVLVPLTIFLVFYLPISGIINFHYQIISVVAERYFYMPLIGLSWFLGIIITDGLGKISKYVKVITVIAIASSSFGQIARWESHEVFKSNQGDTSFYYNMVLGQIQVNEGDLERAEKSFLKAKEVDASFLGSSVGLMNIYMREGDLEKAQVLRKELGERIFDDWDLLSNYISILSMSRRFEEGKMLMEQNLGTYLYSEGYITAYLNILSEELRFLESVMTYGKGIEHSELDKLKEDQIKIEKKIYELEELF